MSEEVPEPYEPTRSEMKSTENIMNDGESSTSFIREQIRSDTNERLMKHIKHAFDEITTNPNAKAEFVKRNLATYLEEVSRRLENPIGQEYMSK